MDPCRRSGVERTIVTGMLFALALAEVVVQWQETLR